MSAEPVRRRGSLVGYDEVIELKALLRLADDALARGSRFRPWLAQIQDDLVDVAADLLRPLGGEERERRRVDAARAAWLAAASKEAAELVAPSARPRLLPPSEAAGWLQLSANAAGRAACCANAGAADYLERLSALLDVLSRAVDRDTGGRPRGLRQVALLPLRALVAPA